MNILRRCGHCRKFFAVKQTDIVSVGKEDIQILERLTQPHLKGAVEKMVDRFVPGERQFYDVHYTCQFCGAKDVKRIWKDVKK